MKKQMNVFGCNKKLANVDPPKRPLEDKLQNLKEIIKFNDDKVILKTKIQFWACFLKMSWLILMLSADIFLSLENILSVTAINA